MVPEKKPRLLIISSEAARRGPGGPLRQFVTGHTRILKQFEIHATGGTGKAILSTGLFTPNAEVIVGRRGLEGGIVELAAMAARRECVAVIFLSDPTDTLWTETYALQRVCREVQVRLVTTIAGAEQWIVYEAQTSPEPTLNVLPNNWNEGISNFDGTVLSLPIEEQTLALISHDKKKERMLLFANKHVDFLSRFHRILTTGTTGYSIKMVFSDKDNEARIETEARDSLGEMRFGELQKFVWQVKLLYGGQSRSSVLRQAKLELGRKRYAELLKEMREREQELDEIGMPKPKLVGPRPSFVEKIMPLPSGPRGGDILIAEQVLRNRCHVVVFFFDPDTAHPHDPDIRLFERTAQVGGVYAICVSDPLSAERWAQKLSATIPSGTRPLVSLRSRICERFALKDAVIVDTDNESASPGLGRTLARAAAGYFYAWLESLSEESATRIGLGQGSTIRLVLEELEAMEKEGLLQRPPRFRANLVWYPVVTNIRDIMEAEDEASTIASDFCAHYGGKSNKFTTHGFRKKGAEVRREDVEIINQLQQADLIIVSATRWDANAAMYKSFRPRDALPSLPNENGPQGLLSAIFLNIDGSERGWDYSAPGLAYSEMQKLAQNGKIVLICGADNRHEIALAALRGGLVSVLITTEATANSVLAA